VRSSRRIARIALAEKSLAYEHVEVDPFAPDVPVEYLDLHPFKRVPALVDGDFVLYDTGAITRYIDEAFPGLMLQPTEPRQRARMAQIISVVDSYGYVPMVRQVAGERVFARFRGRKPDEAVIRTGLERSLNVLDALEAITPGNSPIAGGDIWSLADFHLAPMISLLYGSPRRGKGISPLHQTIRMVGGTLLSRLDRARTGIRPGQTARPLFDAVDTAARVGTSAKIIPGRTNHCAPGRGVGGA
jgi:glutathione S-transferase